MASMLLLLPVIYPGLWGTTSDLLPKRLVLYFFSAVLCLFWLRENPRWRSTPLIAPALAYTFWNLLSLFWAINPFTGWVEALQLIVLLIAFLAFVQLDLIRHIAHLAQAAALGGLIVALIGIAQYLGLGFDAILSVGMPSSTFIFRNLAAAYALGCLPLIGLALLLERHPGRGILWALSFSALLLFLFYTRTRGAWAALGVTCVLGAVATAIHTPLREAMGQAVKAHWNNRTVRGGLLACLVAVLIAGWLPANIPSDVMQQFDEKKATPAAAVASLLTSGGDRGRLIMWRHTVQMIADHPILGVGLDNWEYVYPVYDRGDKITFSSEPVRPHNDLLWIASELGVIGLGCYLWLLASAAKMGVATCKSAQTQHRLIAFTALLGLVALLIYSLFSFPKEQPATAFFFWLYLAMLGAPGSTKRKTIAGRAIPVLGLAVCLCAGYVTMKNIAFDRHYTRARAYETRGEWPLALQEISQALNAGAFDHRALFLKAQYLQKSGQNSAAIDAYLQALKAHPNYAHTYHNLGGAYAAQKAWPQAIAAYKKALDIRPDYYQARLHLGNAYMATGQLDLAVEAYRTMLRAYPDYMQAHVNLGAAYLRQNQLENAVEEFKEALRLQPDNADAYNNLAYTYERLGRLPEAVTTYETLLKYWQGDAAYRETVKRHIDELRKHLEP